MASSSSAGHLAPLRLPHPAQPASTEITLSPRGLSFFDFKLQLGFRTLGLRVRVDGREQDLAYDQVAATADNAGLDASGLVGNSPLIGSTAVRYVPGLSAVVVRHTLSNPSDKPIHVTDARTGQWAPEAGVLVGRGAPFYLRYAHSGNVRSEPHPFCLSGFPFVRPIPDTPLSLGRGEEQPFPALYLTTRDYVVGLLFAAAGHETTWHTWSGTRAPFAQGSIYSAFAIHHDLPHPTGHVLAPGAELVLDGTFCQLLSKAHPQDAHVDYLAFLAATEPAAAAAAPPAPAPAPTGVAKQVAQLLPTLLPTAPRPSRRGAAPKALA